MVTFRAFWRRDSVLKSGTAQSQADQLQQALDEARRLAECHSEQPRHCQARLDCCVTLGGLPATLTGRHGIPGHGGIEPDRQRTSALQRLTVGQSVLDFVGKGCRSAHDLQLPRWLLTMKFSRDLSNRVGLNVNPSPQVVAQNAKAMPRNMIASTIGEMLNGMIVATWLSDIDVIGQLPSEMCIWCTEENAVKFHIRLIECDRSIFIGLPIWKIPYYRFDRPRFTEYRLWVALISAI